MDDSLFRGFDAARVDVGETTIFVRRKSPGSAPGSSLGQRPPLLLLHGFPETHVMWHRIAPELALEFTVVCADLRGYGASGKPASASDHGPYAKKAMAADMVRVMQRLGFERFAIIGHDRGARVAYRLALDHPRHVERVALLDIIPTGAAFARADARWALGFWPWSLLAQPEPLPERLILADPAAVIDDALTHWGSDSSHFPPEVRTAYVEALGDAASAHAICEEYRAAATLDRARDDADRAAGRRIMAPVLALWSAGGALDTWYADAGGPLAIWREWAHEVQGRALEGGHFFPETNAAETLAELRAFLR